MNLGMYAKLVAGIDKLVVIVTQNREDLKYKTTLKFKL